ncbi:MAG: hypothetical protein HS114_34530 [Anaerolineales bacterium]|nr:hypothetical protein [Anaerolineales bacterium]
MLKLYANEFSEIPIVLSKRADLRGAMIKLVETESVAGKVTEGGNRLDLFRSVLKPLIIGELTLTNAYQRTMLHLTRENSIHAGNNKVFATGWAERLVRTQYSRFYNQAVMEELLAKGQTECFVPHSSEENVGSKCSLYLAGKAHNLKALYNLLISSYAKGSWDSSPKIPDHPHCTHVVTPVL